MGARWIMDHRCEVKSAMTLTGLIEALKHEGLLRRVDDLEAAGLLDGSDGETPVAAVLGPVPGVPGSLSLRELAHGRDRLSRYRLTCRRCPASLRGYVGECIVSIPYPISEGMEFVLWRTAVRGLEGTLPETMAARVRAFAHRARGLTKTPFSDDMKRRGGLAGAEAKLYRGGSFLHPVRLSSHQVLDAFFVSGLLNGEELRAHSEFLAAALAVARSLEPAIADPQQLEALREDLAPYQLTLRLLERAQELGCGVYVWP